LGEPPFLTRANDGHHTRNSARVFNPVGQRPSWPQALVLPARPMRRLRGALEFRIADSQKPVPTFWRDALVPAGRKTVTGGGKKRASRAMTMCVASDKKEGHPALRPDTLLVDLEGRAPAQNGGRSSLPTARFIAGRSACAGALVRAAGASFCVEASRTM
jgi:hypothetical protein